MKVFWSWQSDTPGRTGRHFIRQALIEAIEVLKEPHEVEEPVERELKDALHLDQDRSGVSGSPDLARTILDKIDASTVVVADVTPVSVIPAQEDGPVEKRNMNPNVAIELGYAIRSLTDRRFLMVLNTHYGDRRYLPFDLAHKAGPIQFSLAPGADKGTIALELASLRGQFVQALRPYVEGQTVRKPNARRREPDGPSQAVFCEPGKTLATIGADEDYTEFGLPDGQGAFLRIVPHEAIRRPFSSGLLERMIRESELGPLSHNRNVGLRSANEWGAICYEPNGQGPELLALTQVFKSGELWGINRRLLVDNESGKLIPSSLFERTFQHTLENYCKFLADKLDIRPPYTIVGGMVGTSGHYIAFTQSARDWLGPLHDNEFQVEMVLNEASPSAILTATVSIADALYYLSGYPRPGGQFGLLPSADV